MLTASIRSLTTCWICWTRSGGSTGWAQAAAGSSTMGRRASKTWRQAASLAVKAASCRHMDVYRVILPCGLVRSSRPHKDHLEPLLEGGLVIDSGELIGRRLVGQDIGTARIVHVDRK